MKRLYRWIFPTTTKVKTSPGRLFLRRGNRARVTSRSLAKSDIGMNISFRTWKTSAIKSQQKVEVAGWRLTCVSGGVWGNSTSRALGRCFFPLTWRPRSRLYYRNQSKELKCAMLLSEYYIWPSVLHLFIKFLTDWRRHVLQRQDSALSSSMIGKDHNIF